MKVIFEVKGDLSVDLLSNTKTKGGLSWTTILHQVFVAHRRRNLPHRPDGPNRFLPNRFPTPNKHAEWHTIPDNPVSLKGNGKSEVSIFSSERFGPTLNEGLVTNLPMG
jgi:hypothetical protein